MQRIVLVLVLVASLLVLPVGLEQAFAIDTTDLYSCDNPNGGVGLGGEIHLIDKTNGNVISSQTVSIGSGCLSLATDPTDGQMYMISYDSGTRNLATIDPTTGVGSVVGEMTYNNSPTFSSWYGKNIWFDSTGQMFTVESGTNGTPEYVYKVDKTTGIVDTNNLYCDLSGGYGGAFYGFFTLNFDTGDMVYIDGDSTDVYFGTIDETGTGGSCKVGETLTNASSVDTPEYQMGLAYDTVTGDYYYIDDNTSPQDLLSFTTGGTATLLGDNILAYQRGLAFAVSLAPDLTDPIVTGSTTNIVVDGDTLLTYADEYVEFCTATDESPLTPVCSVLSGGIDTSVLGSQSVTYNATDNSGNEGTDTVSTNVVPIQVASDKLYSCDNYNDGRGRILEIDKTNGSIISSQNVTISFSTVSPYAGCLGLAVDPTTGQMYANLRDSSGNRFVTTIDPTTGNATEVGQFTYDNSPTFSDFYTRSIGFDVDGQLYVTESATNGNAYDFWKADKTTGIVDTNNLLCTFGSISGGYYGETVYHTLNYDTGKMMYVDADGSELYIGEIDTTFAGGSCELNTTLTDRGLESEYGQGFAYDSATGNYFFLDHYDAPNDFVKITPAGVTTELGTEAHDGLQKGLTFSVTTSSALLGSSPIVVLIGASPIQVNQHNPSSYVEYGADCSDAEDGVLPISSIDLSGIIFSTVGTYQVEYHCIDSDLNDSIAQRNVVVLFSPIHIYTFDGTPNDSLGGDPFILSDGGAGLNATGWNFQLGEYAHVSNAINEFDYALEMVFQFDTSPDSLDEWNQLIEFHNWQTSGVDNDFDTDAGIWISPIDSYYYECEGTYCDYESNTNVYDTNFDLQHIIFQRNATSEKVNLWLNGVEIMEAHEGGQFIDTSSPEFYFSQPNQIMNLFGTNYIGYVGNGTGGSHTNPEWAGSGYLNCVNIYSQSMSEAEAITRTSFNPVQCSGQSPTAPAYPVTNLNVTNIQEFQADLTWEEPRHEGDLVEYEVQVLTPQGIPVTTFLTTTNTFTTPTELIFGTDYSFDVHAITDSSVPFGRQGSVADFTTLTLTNTTLTLFDQTTCEALPYNGTFSSHSSYDFCGVTDELFLRGGFIYNVDPNIYLSVDDVRIQSTSNFNLNGDMTIRDIVLNEGTITNGGTIQVYPIVNMTLSALHPAVFSDDDGIQSVLDNDGVIINNGLIHNKDNADQLSIIDNSNSIVNNGQVISACLSTYLGSNPTVNARIIEGCLGLIDSFPLDVAWDISTAIRTDFPLPFHVGLYDSSNLLIGSYSGEVTTTGVQNVEATFNAPIPADGLVSVGVGGNNINWLGDDTPADFSSSILPSTFVVDGNSNSSQRTLMTVFHPDQNTADEENSIERFEQTKSIALTVIGVLPVALFFVLFTMLSGRVEGEG